MREKSYSIFGEIPSFAVGGQGKQKGLYRRRDRPLVEKKVAVFLASCPKKVEAGGQKKDVVRRRYRGEEMAFA